MSTHEESIDRTLEMTKMGLVAALYIVLTLAVAPIAFGPVQFRISEILNFLGIHQKRYITALTIGVVVVNFFQFGIVDMVIGGGSTFIFLHLSRYLGIKIVTWLKPVKIDPLLIRYITLIIIFSWSMFTIAGMLIIVGAEAAFLPIYLSLFLSEFIVLILGALIMYPLSQRINFDE